MEHIFIGLAAIVFMLIVVVPVSLWYALSASILWGWFMVPIFNAPTLTVVQCWAVMLTLGSFRPKLDLHKSDPDQFLEGLGAIILGPPLALGIGWAIKNWFM